MKFLKRRDSVIVFTQYTDTMDYLRDKLRHVYGGQVACYSGRGGEHWNGKAWAGTSKENIKTAFRESQEIKILLCTESASEGLNLQTCGVLINYEMPWNPMRVEQRIGRIDRIGQEYDRVWIRNYFYDGTVEATVYQRLDDRIASFESVVGELQPILSQVARVIEAAAMANDKQRGELIAKAIEEINRRVSSAEVSSLNLEEFTSDDAEPVTAVPAPITLKELEKTIAESKALGDRLKPNPELTGTHLFDWHGKWQEVTFNPKLFDEHPNTLTLLSYGSDLLADVLSVVEPPQDRNETGILARCSQDDHLSAVAYYNLGDGGQVATLAKLGSTLDGQTTVEVSSVKRKELEKRFAESSRERHLWELKSSEDRRKAQLSSLTEEIRQFLVEAAYVELALAANRDLFDEASAAGLLRASVPTAEATQGALCGCDEAPRSGLPKPRSDDSMYLRFRESGKDASRVAST